MSAAEVERSDAEPERSPPLDTITLRGLRVHGRHGVHPTERVTGQDFVVDATVSLDHGSAAVSDDLADTVDYAELALRLAAIVAGEPFNLLETLADRLAAACLADRRVRRAEITVHKPQAPLSVSFSDVAVTVVREPDR